jgi:hypothetical protein
VKLGPDTFQLFSVEKDVAINAKLDENMDNRDCKLHQTRAVWDRKVSPHSADQAVSMTHPLNFFHSWAVNGGSELEPFSLQLWATVSLF